MQFSMQTVLGVVFLAIIGIDVGIAQCPAGHGCFRNPSGCGETGAPMCNSVAAWKANDANGIDFFVSGKNDGTDQRWMAIGFSLDTLMGDDDIIMCRQTSTSEVVLEHYWSSAGPPKVIAKETADLSADGLSNIQTSFENNYFACNFTRAIMVTGKAHVYDLSATISADMTPKYYWMIGDGAVSGDVPVQHATNPLSSSAGVDYTVAAEVGGGGDSGESGDSGEDGDAAGHIMASMLLLVIMVFSVAIFTN